MVTAPTHRLTRREIEVLRLLADDHSAKSAARVLGVSPATVKYHAKHVRAKLGAHTTCGAVANAFRLGLWLDFGLDLRLGPVA